MALPSMHRVSVHAMYYKIAMEQAARYRMLNDELTDLQTRGIAEEEIGETQSRIEACYEQREQAAVIAITFSGMSLEAFFYDYAADALGDEYVKAHLDKLDLKSKFVVYPQLVCGKAPDKSKKAYGSLHKLVSLRNDLVHFKSKAFKMEELHKAADFHSELNQKLETGVGNAVKCVMLVMEELDALHGGIHFFTLRMQWSVDP
jgi:hypothetical protein